MRSHEAESLLQLLTDSSKELEELRSAFSRALEYLKQEVEERKCGFTRSLMHLSFLFLVDVPSQSEALCL